jgi:ABC-type multidrug transport system fused ATPase/permease subunit
MANQQFSTPSLLHNIWKELSALRKKQLVSLIFFMVITSIAEVFSIGAVVPFLVILMTPDKIFTNELFQPAFEFFRIKAPEELILPVTLLFMAAAILASTARIFMIWAQARLSMQIGLDFSVRVFENTLYQPYSFHVSRNSSELLAAAQKAQDTVIYFLQPCLIMLSSSIIVLAIVTTLFFINPTIAINLFLGFGVIYVFLILATKRRVAKNSEIFSIQHQRVLKVIQEGLGGIRDVIIDGAQTVYSRFYKDALIPMQQALASNYVVGGSPRFAIEALGMVLIAGLAYFLIINNNSSAGFLDTIPILGAMAIGAQRLLPLLQQIYNAYINLKGYQLVAQDTLELLNQHPSQTIILESESIMPFLSSININGLSYQYIPNGPWVLKNLTLEIPKGSMVGFMGATGSGKSTLLDIVMGLLPATTGTISIDKAEINLRNTRSWQKNIAHVPQTVFLADTSIAENIAFGIPITLIDMERVKKVAEIAQISLTIDGWSEGYGTLVGERGLRLSGGQRQRIGIARALYKEANVIILDEATSALDSETESAVMRGIENLGRETTILIIAHRLSTLKSCDFIVELNNGSIAPISGYKEIIKKS